MSTTCAKNWTRSLSFSVSDGPPGLEQASAQFASEVQATLDGVLPGSRTMVSRGLEGQPRFVVSPSERNGIPLLVGGTELATLQVSIYLSLDRSDVHLKTVRSDIVIKSVLDRTPLLRQDYRADMTRAPSAHWQITAERGSFSHLLTRANATDRTRVEKPHDLSSLHIPVGGERFRPCLEDVLQFLVQECGVDRLDGWSDVVQSGRRRWRHRQVAAVVRDAQSQAAETLRSLGCNVSPGEAVDDEQYDRTFTYW